MQTPRSISGSEGKPGALDFRENARQAGFARQAHSQGKDKVPGLTAVSIQYIVRRTMYTITSSESGNRVRKHEESPGSQGQDAS